MPAGTPIDPRLLKPFLERQRWFAGKARTLADVRLTDWANLDGGGWLVIAEAIYDDNQSETYAVPLSKDSRSGAVSDALSDDGVCRALLASAVSGRPLRFRHGEAPGGGNAVERSSLADLPIRRRAAEQSNTSIVFDEQYVLKLFRRLDPGPNPEVEIGRWLTALAFPRAAALVGALEYRAPAQTAASLLVAHRYVPNEGTAWDHALADLASALHASDPGATYRPAAATLGRRTGELHVALARDTTDPAFAPEPLTQVDLMALVGQVRQEADHALALLESRLGLLAPDVFAHAKTLLDHRHDLAARLAPPTSLRIRAARTRVHGDYHLGQVLRADDDFLIIDFEGEPARTLAERRAKTSPLKDVAGMLRSFGYAARAGLRQAAVSRPEDRQQLEAAAVSWERSASVAFLAGYADVTGGAAFVPAPPFFDSLLNLYLIEKALYELRYELGSRPDWVDIPLQALARLLT
jgi:maltose alpha-D-glucosyltransferase/alpha-amylase